MWVFLSQRGEEAVELPLVMMNSISTLRLMDGPTPPLSAAVSKSVEIIDVCRWVDRHSEHLFLDSSGSLKCVFSPNLRICCKSGKKQRKG